MNSNMQEIPKQKTTRAFASFQNREHQQAILDEVVNAMPKKHQHKLYLYLGMMDSTIAEGYANDNQ
jgi:hypothetical protein